LTGFFPIHPNLVQPEWVTNESGKIVGKRFKSNVSGVDTYHDETQMTHIMGLGTDGLRGLSVLTVARNAIGTGLAGDQAAARMFANGMLVGGLVSTDDPSLSKEDGKALIADLKARLTGSNNAGDIALVNASLKFSPWTMSAEDAQFLESRQYQVEEVSRLLGVPKVLLSEEFRGKLTQQGMMPVANSPADFGAAIREESARWAKVVQQRGLKAN